MDYRSLIKNVRRYVDAYYKQEANPNLLYHNYNHTQKVVQRVKEIGAFYPLTDADAFVLETAALFHDIGQLSGNGENHEEASVLIMQNFLGLKLPAETIQAIKQCIMATKLPHKPTSLLDEIICDADTYNLGTDEFPNTDALLKREYELRGLSADRWDENTLTLLLHHKYFTAYCKRTLNEAKAKNIELVQQRLRSTPTD